MNYDWTYARNEAAANGLTLADGVVKQADTRFAELKLDQHQVDCVLQVHIWHVASLFNPKTYTLSGRIALAWHFLFGKGAA